LRDVSGTWRDLTDSVNFMAGNLTGKVRNIAEVTTAVANGDLSKKITVRVRGEILRLKKTINTMVDQLSSFASEVTRVAREVGTEGRLGGQADVKGVAGTWKDLTDSVNFMASNLTSQVRNIADVTKAVANGDLSKKITVDVKGEILELKNTVNTMVDQLSSFATEVTRVAREVGTEGKLGGQALVRGVAGTWKDLTDNVNMMAANLTSQVRGIARVVTAVAKGDLKQRLTLESKGEIAALASTINEMNDTLATFAEQVTTVAREVGVEGQLGGQARVPGATGTWRDLTDNVNQLASNLTTQVRAIAEVATAVTKGDLTRSITVEAQGEVAALKDNINEMIRNLKDTTQKNSEQDWLKINLAKFSRMLQGQKDLIAVAKLILSELAPVVSAQHGAFYFMDTVDGVPLLKLLSSYAYRERKHLSNQFRLGESLVGQSALEKERLVLTEVPDDYIKIGSGLGESKPRNVLVLPVLFEGEVKAVVELASFNRYKDIHLTFLDQLAESLGIVLNTIAATMRTEGLLSQSRSLAEELQSQQEELKESNARLEEQAASLRASEELLKNQQEELKQTNEELEEQARELTARKSEVDIKNREIELAKLAVQERAEKVALTSKYKSEFLANMSHELRTPLNSMLILADLLAKNPDHNLTPEQVEHLKIIAGAGTDLEALIDDILDMAKIESGTMAIDVGEVVLAELQQHVERTFLPVAQKKNEAFDVELADGPPATIRTDPRRLDQVLRNLLSNALKFTERGRVSLRVAPAASDREALNKADGVVAFAVTDTGIGIPADKLRVIFEPFQQADTGTSRKYGGTGLGLSISREIAGLLGGEIRVSSTPGRGSTFTLYLPLECPASVLRTPAARPERPLPGPAPDPADANGVMPEPEGQPFGDDRDAIQPGDRVVLLVENDVSFARILVDLARGRGFKAVVALGGRACLELARKAKPDAITLDVRLPDLDGWKVLEHLKHDLTTRHIPVHIISVEEGWQRGLKLGAIAYLKKPTSHQALAEAFARLHSFVERRVKNLLVVEADAYHRDNIVELIGNGDVRSTCVATGADALDALRSEPFDCMVLDLFLPDMSGFELIQKIRRKAELHDMPIIIYTGKELTREQEAEIHRLAEASVIKDVRSPERLLDETALFLHRIEADLPEVKK
jgi:signal transduction histidine kinase/HAMP domain-containing protein/DNA-binding response OmpR family regulator